MAGGLLLRSFVKLMDVDRGFVAQQVVTVSLNLPGNRYPDQREGGNNLVSVEGTNVPFMERPLADIRGVNNEYFNTMGIALRQGRIFEEADRDRGTDSRQYEACGRSCGARYNKHRGGRAGGTSQHTGEGPDFCGAD